MGFYWSYTLLLQSPVLMRSCLYTYTYTETSLVSSWLYLVSRLAHTHLPVRNGLVNEVEFLGLITPKAEKTNEIASSVSIT